MGRIKFLREKEGLSGQAGVNKNTNEKLQAEDNELQVQISDLMKTNAGLEGKQEHSKAELKKLKARNSRLDKTNAGFISEEEEYWW